MLLNYAVAPRGHACRLPLSSAVELAPARALPIRASGLYLYKTLRGTRA